MARAPATREAIASRLLAVLPRIHHMMKRDRHRIRQDATGGHSFSGRVGQYRLLMLLHSVDRITTHQIAERMDVSTPTVSGMVRSLVDQGLVGRERDRADQRVVWLAITDAGRAVVEEERARWREVFLMRFSQLDAEDQRRIADAVPALERLVDSDPFPCEHKES